MRLWFNSPNIGSPSSAETSRQNALFQEGQFMYLTVMNMLTRIVG